MEKNNKFFIDSEFIYCVVGILGIIVNFLSEVSC